MHVYRDGALVATVNPEQAKNFTMPANGAAPADVQIVVVAPTGEVTATPAVGDSPAAGASNSASTSKATNGKATNGKATNGKAPTGKSAKKPTADTVKKPKQ